MICPGVFAYLVPSELETLAKAREFFETPIEAVEALLEVELLTPSVWDPCCGRGPISMAVERAGYRVAATDIEDWGYGEPRRDFLAERLLLGDSVVMNPPFSLAEAFVRHAFDLGARKVVAFQRFAWWEGQDRVWGFWRPNPPNRIYAFDARCTSWRGDIPPERREGSTVTPHAWFVWERGQPPGTLTGHLRLKGRSS